MATKTNVYECASGHVVKYEEPAPKVRAYLNRILKAAEDEAVSYDDLIVMIFGKDNPLLDQTIFSGVGAVTPEIFADPVYAVMRDQLERKAIQLGLVDPERDFANYTISVADAAKKLGIYESAVVTAIRQHRLAARKIGGKWRLHPQAVSSYQVQRKKSRNAGRRKAG